MQRYTTASGGPEVSNSSVGGVSARENARVDQSFQTSNFPQNSRKETDDTKISRKNSKRPLPLHPYKLRVDKEPLSFRLGPPDFYPQTPNCPEETLTKEYLQSGYKETVEGIEEAREIVLTQCNYFTKPEIIFKCKEAIRRRFRAINESRAQKRKAGQVYGVPLTGHLLIKPGSFPEQRPSNEDFRKKWIEALSSHTKRLRTLADHVPHGFRRKSLFEVLIRHNVPLLRATWLVKVTYLNQIRPVSTSISSSSQDKSHFTRTELWTKDVVEYLQQLLDEYLSKDGSIAPASSRDQSSPCLLSSSGQRTDTSGVTSDVEEPSLLSKWWYTVHLLHWNYSEGLILPSIVVEWVLNQLQEKVSADAYEMLLPVACEVIEIVALSQTYTSGFVDIAVRSINDLSVGGLGVLEASRRSSLSSAFVEMLRYLMVAAPDTFVALDCFPLPVSVVPDMYSTHRSLKKTEDIDFRLIGKQDAHLRYMSFGYLALSIRKRASNLANIANPSFQGQGSAKIVQLLDKAFISGDVRSAYSALFEDFSALSLEEKWMEEVSPSLRSSLKWIGTVDMSLICSIFFLCEWATCGYRDYRTTTPDDIKFTGMKDFCKVYTAVFLLKLKSEHICVSSQFRNANLFCSTGKAVSLNENISTMASLENSFLQNEGITHSKNGLDYFQSPGPLHDIIVCWLDQHDIGKGGGFKHLQVLIMELIRSGIFYPPAYVRHLIVSGVMDRCETSFDLERRKRHHKILKQLPGACLFDVLEESKILEAAYLNEVVQVYSNERQLVLHGCFGHSSHLAIKLDRNAPFSFQNQNDILFSSKEGSSNRPFNNAKVKDQVTELKILISTLLRFPYSCSSQTETQVDESPGSLKRLLGSSGIRFDSSDGMHACDSCRDAKRQKLTDERSSLQVIPSNQSDDEETWWVRKGTKSLESMKAEPANKLTKNVARGRQKSGRKMQSLSQLAAARIESSQGASTSHVCDHKMSCSHHRSGVEGKVPKDSARLKTIHLSDIGKTIKQLRLLEKRSISIWLSTSIRQLVDGSEKTTLKPSNGNGSFSIPLDDRNTVRWKLGEEELSTILYLLDISSDLILSVRLLLWLLSKSLCGQMNNGHVGRSVMMLTKSKDNHVFQVGEAFLLSALQRYENVIAATDLLPELLSAAMHRTMISVTPSGRFFCAVAFAYSRNLLKKYRDVSSVIRWEKNFRATCDQRLLADLDSGRLLDGEVGLSSGISGGISDFDEFIRQKITGRVSRTGTSMKEIVQRHVEEAMHYFYGKERKPFAASNVNSRNSTEKWDDAYQVAHEIVTGLSDCIRQNGGAALEGDPSIVASAVSSIVGNVGPSVAKVPDFISCNYQNISSTSTSLNCVRYILYIHIISLCLLKEALGERLGRVFEIALAAEASAAISGSLSSVKSHRNPYQPSPEAHDISTNHSNEVLNNSGNFVGLRVAKATAAVSSLVLGAIVHGAANLERMITVFKLKEGLDLLQFIRSARSSSSGISRSVGNFKMEHSVEVLAHWFRLLVGNTRTVCDGLVSEILGESYIIALYRMQRILPLNLVLPPVYSIFSMVIWRPYILNSSIATREDLHFYHHLSLTINDVIRHQPFRGICFQNTHAFYDLLSADVGDSEFAAMLELYNPDKHLKARAFVPLRARLFLNALIDCKMPPNTLLQEDGSFVSEPIEALKYVEMEQNLLNQLVHVLDTLQPAKFHWQWVELRLLLNEKALLDKIDMKDMSLVEGIRSLAPNADNFTVSESDKFLSEIILTRILVRPDAAPLYAEIVHLLGRSLEESLVMDIKWILAGADVLSGRKSIRQQLISVAHRNCLSTKALFWKPWGWSNMADMAFGKGEKRKLETTIEEGEVVDDSSDAKRSSKLNFPTVDADNVMSTQPYSTEKSIAELILPCIDRSSTDLCNSFAAELVKQMNTICQQINTFTRAGNKPAGVVSSGVELSSNKSSRKSVRGGSPGLGRRATTAIDSSPPSAAALKASIWLRLQFLVRLLPIIFADRHLRQTLASIILNLMGTRFIHEDADLSFSMVHIAPLKREVESTEASAATLFDYSDDSLFDTFLCILHGLLCSCRPSWLKPKSTSKSSPKSREISAFDRDATETMQVELDRMELPTTIRRRLQAAIPILPPSLSMSLSSHRSVPPPLVLTSSSTPSSTSTNSAPFQKFTSNRPPIKSKTLPTQEFEAEIDPWTLLEDGTACSAASSGGGAGAVGGDPSNLKACGLLKGSMRLRRTDLTYVGVLDDES